MLDSIVGDMELFKDKWQDKTSDDPFSVELFSNEWHFPWFI